MSEMDAWGDCGKVWSILHYQFQIKDDQVWYRHVDQLRDSSQAELEERTESDYSVVSPEPVETEVSVRSDSQVCSDSQVRSDSQVCSDSQDRSESQDQSRRYPCRVRRPRIDTLEHGL